jgi:hypothetical protein
LTTFTAPYFINPAELGWGPKYGWIWFASCFVTALWAFMFLPETKDRTLEEIDEMVSPRVGICPPEQQLTAHVYSSRLGFLLANSARTSALASPMRTALPRPCRRRSLSGRIKQRNVFSSGRVFEIMSTNGTTLVVGDHVYANVEVCS